MKQQLALVVLLGFVLNWGLFAQAKDFTTTGSGVRVKKIAFVSVKVYSISHAMKEVVKEKNAAAIISAETDKKFVLKMMRDIDSEKIKNAIYEAYANNGNSNKANQEKLFSSVSGDLEEGSVITISYSAASKTVSVTSGGKTSSVTGSDMMQATWSIWFGKIDQASLTQSLMSQIP